MKRAAWPLLLALAACSVQQPPGPASKPSVPLTSLRTKSQRQPPSQPQDSHLSLATFGPVLARPELEDVFGAVQADNFQAAIDALRRHLSLEPPPAPESSRWQYLMAMFYERLAKWDDARAAYDDAASPPWLLSDHARISAARVALRGQHPEAALRSLDQLSQESSRRESVRLMKADALARLGNVGSAIDGLHSLLASCRDQTIATDARLRLAEALLQRMSSADGGVGDMADAPAVEVIRLARRVMAESGSLSDKAVRAGRVIDVILHAADAPLKSRLEHPDANEQIENAEIAVSARNFDQADDLATRVLDSLPEGDRTHTDLGCRASMIHARSRAQARERLEAVGLFDAIAGGCSKVGDSSAWALYYSGQQLLKLSRYADAIVRFAELETRFPEHRLADDARLKRALAYSELGAEARFVALLSSMFEDYPTGDMTHEGVFQLALHRMVRRDWSGAAAVLELAEQRLSDADMRSQDRDRLTYFLARARLELGSPTDAAAILEDLIRDRPFSYYMIQAYTRLVSIDRRRAEDARLAGIENAQSHPFSIGDRPEFHSDGFARVLELLALGDFDSGRWELENLRLDADATPEVLWAVASLYAQAGATKLALKLTKGSLRQWREKWPVSSWTAAWEIAYPRPFLHLVARESSKNSVPEALVFAIMREESEFDPDAESAADAHGLMQLIVPTARTAARGLGLSVSAQTLKRPSVNVALGCRVLGKLLSRFEQLPLLAIPGYNAGPGRPARWVKERPDLDVDVWIESIPYSETREYTKRVLASRAVYTWLYDRDRAEQAMVLPLKIAGT